MKGFGRLSQDAGAGIIHPVRQFPPGRNNEVSVQEIETMNLIANGPGELENFVEAKFIDPNGLMYGSLDNTTLELPAEETYRGSLAIDYTDHCLEGYAKNEIDGYENYGMVSGAFCNAMLLKYKLTGDPEALERARRTIRGFFHVAEIGKELEYGYLPKIYGGRFSRETSTDQYLSIMVPLDEYRRMKECSAAEKARIDELLVAAVEFWRKRNYRYSYFVFENMKWPPLRFPSFLALAYRITGKKEYLDEAEAILRLHASALPENSRFRDRHLNDTEVKTRDKLIYAMSDALSMDSLNAVLFLRNAPESAFASLYRAGLLSMYLEGKRTMAPDGTCYWTVYQHLDEWNKGWSEEVRPTRAVGDVAECGARSGWSTMIMRGSLLAAYEHPALRQEIVDWAKEALSQFDRIEKFSYVDPRDAEMLSERYRFKSRFISADSISNALWSCYLIKDLETHE